jgi:hypothetical protein
MTVSTRFRWSVVVCAVLLMPIAHGTAFAQTRPALTRDVDNGDLNPVRLSTFISVGTTENFKDADVATVPAGKRLVLDNASIWAFTSVASDKITAVWLSVKPGGNFLLLDPAANEVRPLAGGASIAAYNRPVKAYFEAGETVYAQVFADGNASSKQVNIYLQGHYVNVP